MRPTMNLWCTAAVATILALPVQAQDYPNKPITFVTPAAAGNSPDVVTRIVADKLTQLWKQQIVVINRPGAGGLIAAQAAAALPKDGYSIYMTQASTWTVLPILQEGKMPASIRTSRQTVWPSSSSSPTTPRTACCSPPPTAAARRI
jgi:tripartite-type tricarboxylate transporter receptor subunit TctC